jgi:hypothetical protein
VTYSRADTKALATAQMYFLGQRPVEPLGPGSTEKRSALEALAAAIGMDLTPISGKVECGKVLAQELDVVWDTSCYSSGETITLEGLNRLIEGAVSRLETATAGQQLTSALATVAEAPKSTPGGSGEDPVRELIEIHHDIAERISRLSANSESPSGVSVAPLVIPTESVDFETGGWRACLASIQGWLHLPRELDEASPEAFDVSLAEGLGMEQSDSGDGAQDLALMARLAQRLERAVSLREAFLAAMESAAEGAATRDSATQAWSIEWDEVVEEEDSEVGGPIHAFAGTWPIVEFSQYAKDRELNLSPSYQRADVWDTSVAQMLIESVLRGIPLPSVIILKLQDDDGVNYEVVDGKQRLTSILRFMSQHPRALEIVGEKAVQWDRPDLLSIFQTDYPAFKRLWRKHESKSLSAQTERLNYFPFPLRSGDVKPLSGELAPLRGKYYCQIQQTVIDVVGERRPVKSIFETQSKYKLPVIVYEKVTTDQIHEVFSLYNKQGKHLNAEEIRNALYHRLDFMRALLVTAGDSEDVEAVAGFLLGAWPDLTSTQTVLDSYGFGKAGYKRTKLMSWVASVLFFEEGRPDTRSTSSQINLLLKRISTTKGDPLLDQDTITSAMLLLDHGLDAHAAIPPECWAPSFRNSQAQGKWQELQLVASLIGLTAARQVLGDQLEDAIEDRLDQLSQASSTWKRPVKTQSKEQWAFIARVVAELLELLSIDAAEADDALRTEFGCSGLSSLLSINQP